MARVYSAYEAKAKFAELIRRVRGGQRVIISHRGAHVAEISPIKPDPSSLKQRLRRLEEEGLITTPDKSRVRFRPIAKKPGALARFLESRE